MALFAALSYAVTQSGRDGGNIDREQQELNLAVNEQCIGLVEYGENQLKIFNNCADDQISYELPSGGNPNPLAPSDRSCHVFDDAGAGITPCGSFLTVFGVPIASSIAFGDTMTGVILPGGTVFRCLSFGALDSPTECSNFGYSFDNGFTFRSADSANERICLAQDSAEETARGGSAALSGAFRDSICTAACGGTSTGGGGFGGSFTVTNGGYFRPDGIIEDYSGPCVNAQRASNCDCWGSG